jgi:hypothetical protein
MVFLIHSTRFGTHSAVNSGTKLRISGSWHIDWLTFEAEARLTNI